MSTAEDIKHQSNSKIKPLPICPCRGTLAKKIQVMFYVSDCKWRSSCFCHLCSPWGRLYQVHGTSPLFGISDILRLNARTSQFHTVSINCSKWLMVHTQVTFAWRFAWLRRPPSLWQRWKLLPGARTIFPTVCWTRVGKSNLAEVLTHIDSHLFLQLPLFILAAVSGLVNINHSSLFRKTTISKWWLYRRLVLFVSFLGCVGSCRQSRCLVALVSDVMMLIRKPWWRKLWRWEWYTNKEDAVMSMFPLIGWCLMLITMPKDDDWRWWDEHI